MHCTNYTLPNTEAALQCCSAMDTLCREVINGVPIAIGQPECNIYTFVILRFYVIGTSSFHDISAAIYTYINVGLYRNTRELLLRPAHIGDLYYTTAHDCLLCMHPHKGCNAYLNRHSAIAIFACDNHSNHSSLDFAQARASQTYMWDSFRENCPTVKMLSKCIAFESQ